MPSNRFSGGFVKTDFYFELQLTAIRSVPFDYLPTCLLAYNSILFITEKRGKCLLHCSIHTFVSVI